MVSDHEKSEITCLAAQDWKSFIQSRSKEMKKGKKVKKETITLICQSQLNIIKQTKKSINLILQYITF